MVQTKVAGQGPRMVVGLLRGLGRRSGGVAVVVVVVILIFFVADIEKRRAGSFVVGNSSSGLELSCA